MVRAVPNIGSVNQGPDGSRRGEFSVAGFSKGGTMR
jgi:hypothetical protein